jgi:hypothetical protein
MNISQFQGISYCVFVISKLVSKHSQVYLMFPLAQIRVPKLIKITPMLILHQSFDILVSPVPVISNCSYCEGRPKCTSRVGYSPVIDPSKVILHILSDTLETSHWLIYILLMHHKSKLTASTSNMPGIHRTYSGMAQDLHGFLQSAIATWSDQQK